MTKRGGRQGLVVVCRAEGRALFIIPGNLLGGDGIIIAVCNIGTGVEEIERHAGQFAAFPINRQDKRAVLR